MNILVRLSPALVYGDKAGLVEILGDRIGLSISDINEIIVGYFEYVLFNCASTFCDRDVTDTCFMGDPMGRDILYAVTCQLPEINAYIPTAVTSIRYARTQRDGFYLICEINE